MDKNIHAVELGRLTSARKKKSSRENWDKAVASGKLGRPKKSKNSLDNYTSGSII